MNAVRSPSRENVAEHKGDPCAGSFIYLHRANHGLWGMELARAKQTSIGQRSTT